MEYHLYLSLIPESLVVSMLPAQEFGRYLAVGTKKRAKEQAIYFELSNDFESEYFDLPGAIKLCTPHEDGQPKHSVYVSTYRVLEHVPLKVIGSLWLVTSNGLALELKQNPLPAKTEQIHHLYQELCPVHPLIASTLGPSEFCNFITDPQVRVSVPKICFLDLRLGTVPEKSNKSDPGDLPYKNIKHLWNCMLELTEKNKTTKTVNRVYSPRVLYRCIKSGFYVGDQHTLLYYPFPSSEEMEKKHHRWWRWAQES
ncbi:MAG: hypothetical protein ACXACF_04425 [Candidatus Hermodarchaeia archaeon]|jgi:hypothetical protein|nr:MAG: hypothetical protein JSW00_06935 [Thermoplasmata archaeon]